MLNDSVIKDPVFQLNLLLWMSKEQPTVGYRVRPFFYEQGFRLVYIEHPFAFPDETARAIASASLDISKSPEPELILGRELDKKALYFEAKAGSFGPDSSNSRQARAHLLACGPAFGETLAPLQRALLCYVVPKSRCDLMAECLSTITAQLHSASLVPGSYSVHGLELLGQDLVYSWDSSFKGHVAVGENSVAVLHDLQTDTDPSPLLLIFSDQDCPNAERSGYYRRVLINQVVAKLVSDLNLLPLEQDYSITARDLLQQTTGGIMDYLGLERQTGMIRIVRQNIFRRIASFWSDKQFTPIHMEVDVLRVNFKDNLAKAEFMDWLEDPKRTCFGDQMPAIDLQLLLGTMSSQEESD